MYTELQLAQVKGIRARGDSFEAVVTHPSLPRHGLSRVFTDPRAARIWKLDQLALLNEKGALAAEVVSHAKRPDRVLDILEQFASKAPNLSRTMKLQAGYLRSEPALDVSYSQITPTWVQALVASYKTGKGRITPQSIRKKIDCLRIAIDWYHQTYWALMGLPIPTNVLAHLPRKYQNYDEADPHAKVNRRRRRRLMAGEEPAIENVINGVTKRRCRRPVNNPVETLMLFRLIINSALRLREAYTLRAVDVDMTRALINVRHSKLSYKGEASGTRTVPVMHAQLYKWLKEYMEAKGITPGTEQPLFACWWDPQAQPDKSYTPEQMDAISNSLSQMFAALFKDAGCENLVAHDARHEAVSRWCELKGKDGKRRYNKADVMKFTGHTTESTFDSYLHYFMDDHVPEDVLALMGEAP